MSESQRDIPRTIQGTVGIRVDFNTESMRNFDRMPYRKQRAAMEEIESRLYGGRPAVFRELMDSPAWNPRLTLHEDTKIPLLADVHESVRQAVIAYNQGGFPMKFRDDQRLFEKQFGTGVAAAPAARTGRTAPSDLGADGNPQHTCVVWIWREGELVPEYNYDLEPLGAAAGDGGTEARGARAARPLAATAEEAVHNVFEDIDLGVELWAKYQMTIYYKLRFPLPKTTRPVRETRRP